jgi:hypothetical protein
MEGDRMAEQTWWETTKVQGDKVLETVKGIVREGNVRRIVIKQGEDSIAEFPLTAGVVGAVFAPVLAAIGALAALLTDCTIAVERAGTRAAAPAGETGAGETPVEPPVVSV